ncbi:MAG: mobile mystery protein A [Terriglobia bacterium]
MKDIDLHRFGMKDREALRLQQLEETIGPFRDLGDPRRPSGGWVRAVREALGMTNVQLAKRLKIKAPQTIEDMQKSETTETIQIKTLRKLAEALGCRVVYAVVPPKALGDMRRDRARSMARRVIQRVSHSMKLEAQGVSTEEEERQLNALIEKILAGNPRQLWD